MGHSPALRAATLSMTSSSELLICRGRRSTPMVSKHRRRLPVNRLNKSRSTSAPSLILASICSSWTSSAATLLSFRHDAFAAKIRRVKLDKVFPAAATAGVLLGCAKNECPSSVRGRAALLPRSCGDEPSIRAEICSNFHAFRYPWQYSARIRLPDHCRKLLIVFSFHGAYFPRFSHCV